ncbi:MAG TPA: phosphoribosylglycinamide formyltransferase [Planctomycetota bacterium]|nr:phosphoribosylglycinamide formyltransferase [Planctomycetota bacterium]
MTARRLRLAVLVSGSGRSLRNLLERSRAGTLPADVALVISSRADAGALQHAAAFGVKALTLKTGEVTAAIDAAKPDLVVMAGYLRAWPLPDRWAGRTINIHPALLPLFGGKGMYGRFVHEAALASGMKISGCTVHFVTQNYDDGPIIVQRTCPVLDDDDASTLAARVFAEELEALPEAIRLFAEDRLRIEGRRVRVSPSAAP